jgi:hypothetical protein
MMSNPSKPICSYCEHFKLDVVTPQCWHPKVLSFDPIFGNQPANARTMRDIAAGPCGPDGKLFEQSQPGPFAVAFGEFFEGIARKLADKTPPRIV